MMAFTEESDGCSLGLCTWQIGGAETQSMDFVCQQALSWNSLLPQSFDVAKIVTVTAHSEKTGTWGGSWRGARGLFWLCHHTPCGIVLIPAREEPQLQLKA